jgi:hypothetical protein
MPRPDSDGLHSDLCLVGYKYMSDGKLLLEATGDIKKRGMPSPDEGDAVALCFSEPNGSPFPNNNGFNRIEYPGRLRPPTPEVAQGCKLAVMT